MSSMFTRNLVILREWVRFQQKIPPTDKVLFGNIFLRHGVWIWRAPAGEFFYLPYRSRRHPAFRVSRATRIDKNPCFVWAGSHRLSAVLACTAPTSKIHEKHNVKAIISRQIRANFLRLYYVFHENAQNHCFVWPLSHRQGKSRLPMGFFLGPK